VGGHAGVTFSSLFLVVEMLQFLEGRKVDVVADVTEQSGGDAPQDSLVTSLFDLLLDTLKGGFRSFGVHDFVEASMNMTTGELLEHDSGLHEKAAIGDFASHFLPVSQPDEETGVPALAVDGQEIEIVVEASESCANIEFLEIRSSWGQ